MKKLILTLLLTLATAAAQAQAPRFIKKADASILDDMAAKPGDGQAATRQGEFTSDVTTTRPEGNLVDVAACTRSGVVNAVPYADAKSEIVYDYGKGTMYIKNPVRNFDEYFYAPHSRHTEVDQEKMRALADIDILAESDEAGIYLAASKDRRRVFVFGHGEYDKYTLDSEYRRDMKLGRKDVEMPVNYYDGNGNPKLTWRAHSSLLMSNWLNYYVYQETPYDINTIG